MKCSDLQFDLSLYADGVLDERAAAATTEHLEICPLCRQAYADIREIRAGLRQMPRPELSRMAVEQIRSAVGRELKTSRTALFPLSHSVREWLQMSVLPYGAGTVAS